MTKLPECDAPPFDLQRFVNAQAPVYEQVLRELRAGRKTSHWMWFIFPQIHGLGSSSMARKYAIADLEEAEAYLTHPVLGPRLSECVEMVCAIEGRTAEEIFGYPDDLKFRSSLTLFIEAAATPKVFEDALCQFFGGTPDAMTQERLR